MKTSFGAALVSTILISSAMAQETADSEPPINVHFVPHSYMHAGWKKTYDEYYTSEVSKIFKSVI